LLVEGVVAVARRRLPHLGHQGLGIAQQQVRDSANAFEFALQSVHVQSIALPTAVRLKVEQIQLVSGVGHVGLGRIGLQGA
jgi:hypothetical protein